MKVAVVAYGHSDNVICLTKALSNYADVTLLFITSGPQYTSSIFDWNLTGLPFGYVVDALEMNGFICDSVKAFLGPCTRIRIARTHSRKLIRDWLRRNYACVKKTAEYVRKQGFDVVHFNGSSGFQFYFHFLLSDLPRVLTIHDYLPHTGESPYPRKLFSLILNGFYAGQRYEFIQHYNYLTEQFSKTYNIDPNRVHTVRCGPLDVYKMFANRVVPEEPSTILFFGRISRYKGLEFLLSAFEEVKAIIPRARLIIAGRGSMNLQFKDTCSYEIFNYHVPSGELGNLIQRATVVVAPYTDATHSAVIMTAYAFQKPVIASAVGGIPEVIEDGVTGKLVPPRDTNALASAIAELLLDPKKRERMKANIAEQCGNVDGKLSWNTIAQKTIGVYRKAMMNYRL